jgi:hypothetical protein
MKIILLKLLLKVKYSKIVSSFVMKINDAERNYHLKNNSYVHPIIELTTSTENKIKLVKKVASQIYGETWNYYSDALRDEVSKNFEDSIKELKNQKLTEIKYLEIGSAQGMSMSLNGLLLNEYFNKIDLTSLDPYFENGYFEGEECISKDLQHITINKSTKEKAFNLYKSLNLNVELIEKTSFEGLIDLINNGKKFNYIYIDGFHENFVPMQDLSLCLQLLEPNGIILLDDHQSWEDVGFLKYICDKNMDKISESWKIIAYKSRN